MASAASHFVIRQPFTANKPAEVARVGLSDVAVLSTQQDTPVSHVMAIKRRVTLGCDIPVERQAKIEPPVITEAKRGKKKAGPAFIANRKGNIRKI